MELDAELLDKKMKEFLKIGWDRDTGNARYGVVFEDGTLEDTEYSYCHGKLAGLYNEEYYDEDEDEYRSNEYSGLKAMAIVNQIQSVKVEEHHALRYYEWLFNFSPFRMVFPEKDFEKVYERGIFVASTDVPANLMVGGLMASRFPTENYDDNGLFRLCTLWNDLVDRDVHPNLAYSIASMMKVSVDNSSLNIASMEGGHQALAPYRYNHTHKNFLNDSPIHLLDNYRDLGDYSEVNAAWGTLNSGTDHLNKPLTLLMDTIKSASTGANPFKMASSRGGYSGDYRGIAGSVVSYQEALKPLSNFLNEQTPLLMAA